MPLTQEQANKLKKIAAAGSISLAVSLCLIKGLGVFYTDSLAVLSSMVDSLSDIFASLITLIAVRISVRPADCSYRYGYGKAEALSALFQAAFIAVSGLKMFKDIDLGENKNLFVVSAILIAGIGGLVIKIPYQIADNGLVTNFISITSIATALILGIITHAIINAVEKKQNKDEDAAPSGDEVESLITGAVAPNASFEISEEGSPEGGAEISEDVNT